MLVRSLMAVLMLLTWLPMSVVGSSGDVLLEYQQYVDDLVSAEEAYMETGDELVFQDIEAVIGGAIDYLGATSVTPCNQRWWAGAYLSFSLRADAISLMRQGLPDAGSALLFTSDVLVLRSQGLEGYACND